MDYKKVYIKIIKKAKFENREKGKEISPRKRKSRIISEIKKQDIPEVFQKEIIEKQTPQQIEKVSEILPEIKKSPFIKPVEKMEIKPELEPEPEPKLKQELKELEPNFEIKQEIEKKDIIENKDDEFIHYRLGRTTKNIMDRLIRFINVCIDEEGMFKMHPDVAADELKLGNKAKQVFINQLSSIRLGTKPLILKNKYDEYYSNFSAKQIIDYISEIKND